MAMSIISLMRGMSLIGIGAIYLLSLVCLLMRIVASFLRYTGILNLKKTLYISCLLPILVHVLLLSCLYLYLLTSLRLKVSKCVKIRNRYNQVQHLTQDTNGKVTNSQLDTTNESQEVSPFPAGDHKAHINRRTQRHSIHKTETT